MSVLLTAKNINKTFSNVHTIIKQANISLEKGKVYVIEGKSGSGKSTLLSMLGGLEPPTKGKVMFKGKSFYDLEENEQATIRGKSFGFVFQSFHLIPELTVKENIELPIHFITDKNHILNIQDLTKILKIDKKLNHKPAYLSGGEQQRVAIARALITNPEIIFADEPTGNLDYKTTKIIVDLLSKLNIERQITLVIVTHERGLINIPHTKFEMEDGQLRVVHQYD